MTAPDLILCSTPRLARSLRIAYDRRQQAQGLSQWQPLLALTLGQWLDDVSEQALLLGDIDLDEAPRMVLNASQERLLWEQVIERTLGGDTAALFDRAGLASAAMEANRLMQEWDIALPQDGDYALETQQFLQWRAEFRRQCREQGWLERARYLDWQIAQLEKSSLALPTTIFHAGYDRFSPQEQRLLAVLKARGSAVSPWPHLLHLPAVAEQIGLADREAECRAAVAWAAQRLTSDPQARLAIVAPELASLREQLTALLDDVLHPAALAPAHAQSLRSYDLSLGAPLARQPLVMTALGLLRLSVSRRNLAQPEFSALLLGPYWLASDDADAHARLDAEIRASLPLNLSLERLQRFVVRQAERGLSVQRLAETMQTWLQALIAMPARQLPSLWAQQIAGLLDSLGWPGKRSQSSHEFQARRAFDKVLVALGGFDRLTGSINFAQAVQRMAQLCSDQVFQPESQDAPRLLVMGMLETVAEPLDAIWVMGMNDHLWPPPANPNPLLPAGLQRTARSPGADGPVQAEFASRIQQRLLRSAPELLFSWAHKSGESELRGSPLLQGLVQSPIDRPEARTLAERLAEEAGPESRQWLDDHVAPPVLAGERLSGGAGLIKAQAICPAWAFYRYRLGARRLEEAIDGLGAMDRGTLVHAVLQAFWQGRDSAWLQALDVADLQAAISAAVDAGIAQFSERLQEPLSPNFLALEQQRLRFLLDAWLAHEKQRAPFSVMACERTETLELEGMTIKLTLDRVDQLEGGELVVIDYKTGSVVSHSSWADARITEPQLPIYASLVLAGETVAAVCFAQVRADEQRFVGVAADGELLPGVKSLQEANRVFAAEAFPNWPALLAHWRSSIRNIAAEIAAGEAAVWFSDENDLRDCEVKPLLRLPERQLQMEAAGAVHDGSRQAEGTP